jgi:hypothetical protein
VVLAEGEKYLLLPGCACLGITEESINLSGNLCGLLEGRSRFARLGLFVHITAGFMNPGINNRQVSVCCVVDFFGSLLNLSTEKGFGNFQCQQSSVGAGARHSYLSICVFTNDRQRCLRG